MHAVFFNVWVSFPLDIQPGVGLQFHIVVLLLIS
jgi:hypothetical protein